eukprot:SAG11_NODE_2390_length_3412_cov_7.894959_2_plen_181_part_00
MFEPPSRPAWLPRISLASLLLASPTLGRKGRAGGRAAATANAMAKMAAFVVAVVASVGSVAVLGHLLEPPPPLSLPMVFSARADAGCPALRYSPNLPGRICVQGRSFIWIRSKVHRGRASSSRSLRCRQARRFQQVRASLSALPLRTSMRSAARPVPERGAALAHGACALTLPKRHPGCA